MHSQNNTWRKRTLTACELNIFYHKKIKIILFPYNHSVYIMWIKVERALEMSCMHILHVAHRTPSNSLIHAFQSKIGKGYKCEIFYSIINFFFDYQIVSKNHLMENSKTCWNMPFHVSFPNDTRNELVTMISHVKTINLETYHHSIDYNFPWHKLKLLW